jgi:hypothetical protein
MGFLRSPKLEDVGKGIFLGNLSNKSPFHLPSEQFGYHFAFYGVTGSGKTRLAMKLAIESENSGIRLIILDVGGEWKNLIPLLKGKTDYYATYRNLKVNPFDCYRGPTAGASNEHLAHPHKPSRRKRRSLREARIPPASAVGVSNLASNDKCFYRFGIDPSLG